MQNKLVCATVQYDIVWHNTDANIQQINTLCEDLEADIIVLPEMFNTGFSMRPEAVSEQEQTKAVDFLQDLAFKKDALVIASAIFGKPTSGFYNRLHVCHPDGKQETYDKRHLFSFAGEPKHYVAGKKRLTVFYKGWKINPLVCYDLRFPVYARNNAKDPFDVQIFVANWPEARIAAWDVLLQARAIENQCYTVGVNRIGTDDNGIGYNGHSLAFDPYGVEKLSYAESKAGVKTFEISQRVLAHFRAKFPVLKDADSFTLD